MRLQRRERNEDGASLIIAMLFVTVVSFITLALLGFADTGIRTTEGLRQQGNAASAADGAAKVAVNTLRNSSTFMYSDVNLPLTPNHCFGANATDTLSLPALSTQGTNSAMVQCTPQAEDPPAPILGVINTYNTPGNAILTLGTTASDGIDFGSTPAGNSLEVSGSVRSNSTIKTGLATLYSHTSVGSTGLCTGTIIPVVNTCNKEPIAEDPNYPAPAAPPTRRAVPKDQCLPKGGLVTFTPNSIYSDSVALNSSNCDGSKITMWFPPGTYYFDFPASAPKWEVDNATVVGGQPQGWSPYSTPIGVPPIPGSCVSPLASTTTAPAPDLGVQFVFGGASQWAVGNHASAEICGSYSKSTPPVAIYGLQSLVNGVPALTATGCASPSCALVSSTTGSDDRSNLYVQGTTYAPTARIAITAILNGQHFTNMFFNGGVIARSVSVNLSGVIPNVIALPGFSNGTTTGNIDQRLPESVAWLQVYVCAYGGACTMSTPICPNSPDACRRLQLRAKVGLSEPTLATSPIVAGARTVKVYSWAVQR
jgi:Tfp pilus assembly protein PilX